MWFVVLEMSSCSNNTRAIQRMLAMPQLNRPSRVQSWTPLLRLRAALF